MHPQSRPHRPIAAFPWRGALRCVALAFVLWQPVTAAAAPAGDGVEADLQAIFDQVDDFRGIEAEVSEGVVHLTGTVVDDEARDRAVELAEAQSGVVYVDDAVALSTDVRARLRPAAGGMVERLQDMVGQLPFFGIGVLIVALFAWLSRLVGRWDRLFRPLDGRPLLRNTVRRLIRTAVVLVGVLIALEIVNATALAGAVLGTAGVFGLALGFAFQDIVENYLAGLLLSVQQPFSKDDLVEIDGTRGVVVRLTTRNTLLLTPDGNHIYLPNASVFKSNLTNYSRNPHRRFEFEVGVGVDEDLSAVIDTGLDTLHAMPGVLDDPAPAVHIGALGDSSVVMKVYGWVDQRAHDFVSTRTEAIRRVKEAYDEAGYDMPEPIYRVQMRQAEAPRPPRRGADPDAVAVDLRPRTELQRQAQAQRSREPGTDLLADA